jgi:hypothetical protein
LWEEDRRLSGTRRLLERWAGAAGAGRTQRTTVLTRDTMY